MSSAKPIPHPVAQPYDSDQEVLEVVRRFEHLEFTPAEFAHAFHLAVGLAYLRQYPGAQALQKMRAGLQRMNAHYGRHGYHETITRFWVRMVEHGDRSVAGLPLFEAANRLTSELADKNLLFTYYTNDRVMSDAARHAWIEPDLQPLP